LILDSFFISGTSSIHASSPGYNLFQFKKRKKKKKREEKAALKKINRSIKTLPLGLSNFVPL